MTIKLSQFTHYVPPATSHLFKAILDIKKHHLTGLLVIKKMYALPAPPPTPPHWEMKDSAAVYRIVFMNEIGMTFFDLEMKPDSFKVISCFESLNKKVLMKIFETDFRMMTWSGSLKSEKIYRQAGTNNVVASGKAGKYKTWQTYSSLGDTLYSIAAKSTIADPVVMTFDKYRDGFPLKIVVENPFIGMKLSLKKLANSH